MLEETKKYEEEENCLNSISETSESSSLVPSKTVDLNAESLALIEKIIVESDERKAKDLTHLFNNNQNKKTLIRVNKLNDLLDTITDQALTRFTAKPDEISNKELFDGLKVVQDLIERGQKQVSGVNEINSPLIQVNQQTNEVNIGNSPSALNRDSRERVKSAVLSLLDSIANKPIDEENADTIIVEAETTLMKEDNDGE